MKKQQLRAISLLIIIFFGFTAYSKSFQNSYISFQLPDNWSCELEGTEWVCLNKFVKKYNEKKEAIIILTAKEKGPSDSITAYEAHLKAPRKLINSKGQKYESEIKQVKERRITLQPWIDGLHLGSEVQHYYTRYLATTKGQIAILVTFTAHKDHYSKYANDFIRAIQTLKVIASDEILAGSNDLKTREQDLYALPVGTVLNDGSLGDDEMYADNEQGGSSKSFKIILGVLLLAAGGAGAYFISKK